MRKISLFLILALLVSLLASCNLKNGDSNSAEEMDNDELQAPIDAITNDSENDSADTEPDSESHEEREETAGMIDESDSAIDMDAPVDSESATSREPEAEVEDDTEGPAQSSPVETESDGESVTSEDSGTIEDSVTVEPETEAYDGMEVVLPDSAKLISEAHTVGLTTGFSVAKGSAKIVQPDKDNPNIIQIVFETDDSDIRIAVNYHRKSENSKWKLVTGLPISVLNSEEN